MNAGSTQAGIFLGTRVARLAFVLLPALVGMGCGPGDDPGGLACGQGTENRNGTCVAIVDVVSSCGEGTQFDEVTGECAPTIRCGEGSIPHESGECVPEARCGPGTELELATGLCIAVASCGPGTVLNEVTGECRSEAECGVGTALEGGECVALDTCAEGTVRNLDNGLCESSTECGPGQVVVSGQCVNPNVGVGLEADHFESMPDQNDPLYGGEPEPISLKPIGERTVFVGNIGRPADLGGNGALVQDRDLWSFSGTAGQHLNISVLGTGLPQPAFILDGPKGYRRYSALLSTNNTSRRVTLPYDGEYRLTVLPTAYISTNLPVGGLNAGYVGVVEELAWPTPRTVVPAPDQGSPLDVTGNLRNPADSFLLLDADVGAAVYLSFRDALATTPPAILAFDGSGELITHVDLNLSEGAWVGTLVKDEPGTTVVVDWQSSTTANDAYTLEVSEVPHVQGGTTPSHGFGSTRSVSIPSFGMAAYTVTVPSPLILFWNMQGTTLPDLQLQNDDGTYVIVNDSTSGFFFADPSTYTFFVHNDTSTHRPSASLVYEAVTPHDFGPLDPADPIISSTSGHLLTPDFWGPRSAWFVARATEPALLRFNTSVEIGVPVLAIYTLAGEKLHDRSNVQFERPVHAVTDGSPILIELDAGTSLATLGWEVSATALPMPPRLDVEPNDFPSTAVDLGPLPAATLGSLTDLGSSADPEVDMFKLTLDEPLELGQSISIFVENLESTGRLTTSDSLRLYVYDERDQPIPSTDLRFGNNHLEVFLSPADTQASSTFYIKVEEEFMTGTQDYLLYVQVTDQPVEYEPNNTLETADEAPSLPYSWAGQWSAQTDTDPADWYSFTLEEPLGFDRLLRVRMHNMSDNNSTTVEVHDSFGNIVGRSTSPQAEMHLAMLFPGRYYIRFYRSSSYAIAYRIDVDLMPMPPTELEPNNTGATANPAGVLEDEALFAFGYTSSSDPDWFSFTLDEPLEDDEGLRVRCMNIGGTRDLACALYDLTDPASPELLASAHEDEAVMIATHRTSTRFGVRLLGTASGSDFYYLHVERGGAAEREPNNTPVQAQPLGALGPGDALSEMGNAHASDEDWFSFTLRPGFGGPNDGIWVRWQNYTSTSRRLMVELFDVTDTSNPVRLSEQERNSGVLVSAPSGGLIYAVRVRSIGDASDANDLYRVWVETGPRGELEPNDTSATANELGALPATIHGVVGDGAVDIFAFTLDADLEPTEVVEVSFENLNDTSSYSVSLRAVGDPSRPRQLYDDLGDFHSAFGLSAGQYEIVVDGLGSSGNTAYSPQTDAYALNVRVIDTTITP